MFKKNPKNKEAKLGQLWYWVAVSVKPQASDSGMADTRG